MPVSFDTGDTAWLLASSALVLFMTPGLAFFYGGMVRVKSVLNMIMMSGAAMAIVSVLWVLYGYTLSFTTYNGFIGSRAELGLRTAINQIDLKASDGGPGALGVSPPGTVDAAGNAITHYVPTTAFVMFQLMFAIITVALISGAIADRAKFSTWCVFVVLWATCVYFPVAHWVFYSNNGKGGWIIDQLHAIDFAGGTAVHINSGAAGLACCLVIGRRKGWRKDPMRPHNVPFVFLGVGMLWFGWFGFNAGSALTSGTAAGVTFTNTQTATAAAMIGWLIIERVRDGHFTTVGAASGAVAGLVGITPSCSSVNPMGAMAVGLFTGAICAVAIGLKFRFGFDDSLDVVGVHMIGGLTGTLLIGLFATDHAPAGVNGLFYHGGTTQLKRQAIGAFAVMGYSFFVTLVIAYLLHLIMGFRISEDDELEGIDISEHAESAYELQSIGSALSRGTGGFGGGGGGGELAFAGAAPPGAAQRPSANANSDGGTKVEL
ncbi:MAG TPA: ammonium transporter [Sporichthyaceae bacterium]|jgi:Amt family ammonium transporter|nr:ammonium transporter [Sporichthyaceae bacterium]